MLRAAHRFLRSLSAVLLGLALASAPARPAEEEPTFAPLVERARAALVLVDVRVVDEKGMPVRGLRPEDFVLRVDGNPAEIASFEEILPLAAPEPAAPGLLSEEAAPSPAYFVLFFDQIWTDHNDQRFGAATADRILAKLRPEDRFAVVALGRRLKVLQPMTRAADRQFESIGELLADPDIQDAYADQRRSRLQEIIDLMTAAKEQNNEGFVLSAQTLAESYTTEAGNRAHQLLEVVRNVLTALEPIRERKFLLYFSAGLPQYPGAEYLAAADLVFTPSQAEDDVVASRRRSIAQSTRETSFALERLFHEANSGRTSIFPIDVRGLAVPTSAAAPVGISFSAIDSFESLTGEKNTLISLALNTGGTAIFNTNDMTDALTPAIAASRNYYLLGFVPETAGDGRYHRIEVEARDPRITVQARAGFIDFTAEQIDERQVTGAFLLPEMFTALPLQVEVLPLERRGRFWYAQAQVRVAVDALDRLPQGRALAGQLEVGTSLFRGSALEARFDRALTLRFSGPQAALSGGEIIFQHPFRLRPGSYVGVTVARDSVSGQGGGSRVEFELPGKKTRLFVALGKLPGRDILSLPPAGQAPAQEIPLLAGDRQVIWARPGRQFAAEDVIVVAYLLPGDAGDPPAITHTLARDGTGVVRTSHPLLEVVGKRDRDLTAYEEIAADRLSPGRYTLTVTVGEGHGTRSTEVTFEILAAGIVPELGETARLATPGAPVRSRR